MSQVDSTALVGRGQCAVTIDWCASLHRRVVDRLQSPAHRLLLARCWLSLDTCAGWPSLALRAPSGLEVPRDVLAAYQRELQARLVEAATSLAPPPPPPADGGHLAATWQQVLNALELPSTRMLLSQQSRLAAVSDLGVAVLEVVPHWLAMTEARRDLLEQAFARTLGRPVALTLVPAATAQEVG